MEPTIGETGIPLWTVAPLAVAIASLCLMGSFRAARRRRQLQFAPMVKAKGAFVGLVQIQAMTRCVSPLVSYLAESLCAYYRCTIEEQYRRTVTESDGKGGTRTRTETGWNTVYANTQMAPFELVDESGAIRVRPEGAIIDGHESFDQTVTASDWIYYGKGPPGGIAHSTGRRRFRETIIPLGVSMYVCGTCRERDDIADLEVVKGELDTLFLIDKDDSKHVAKGFGYRAAALLVLSLAIMGLGLSLTRDSMSFIPTAIVSVAVYVVAWIFGNVVNVTKSLIEIANRVKQAHSNLDVHLKRRHSLIPQLATCARAYAQHEGEAMDLLRRGGTHALVERYPQLAAQPIFSRLQAELIDTENRVALAREYAVAADTSSRIAAGDFPRVCSPARSRTISISPISTTSPLAAPRGGRWRRRLRSGPSLTSLARCRRRTGRRGETVRRPGPVLQRRHRPERLMVVIQSLDVTEKRPVQGARGHIRRVGQHRTRHDRQNVLPGVCAGRQVRPPHRVHLGAGDNRFWRDRAQIDELAVLRDGALGEGFRPPAGRHQTTRERGFARPRVEIGVRHPKPQTRIDSQARAAGRRDMKRIDTTILGDPK